jgi:hypothetical protein
VRNLEARPDARMNAFLHAGMDEFVEDHRVMAVRQRREQR